MWTNEKLNDPKTRQMIMEKSHLMWMRLKSDNEFIQLPDTFTKVLNVIIKTSDTAAEEILSLKNAEKCILCKDDFDYPIGKKHAFKEYGHAMSLNIFLTKILKKSICNTYVLLKQICCEIANSRSILYYFKNCVRSEFNGLFVWDIALIKSFAFFPYSVAMWARWLFRMLRNFQGKQQKLSRKRLQEY